MKRLILFWLLIVLFIQPSLSQVYEGVLNGVCSPKRVQVVFDETDYFMEMIADYGDVVTRKMLSFGIYSNIEDSIILCDRMNGSEWILRRDGCDSLLIEKGLSAIASMNLVRHKDNIDDVIKKFSINCVFNQSRAEYKSQTDLRDLQFGLYEFVHPGAVGLNIFEDGKYNYIVDDIVLSEGRWNRQGNLVEFNDNCLGEAFFAFIEDDYIVPEGFPGIAKISGKRYFRIIPEEEYGEYIPMFTSEEFEKHPDSMNYRKSRQ